MAPAGAGEVGAEAVATARRAGEEVSLALSHRHRRDEGAEGRHDDDGHYQPASGSAP